MPQEDRNHSIPSNLLGSLPAFFVLSLLSLGCWHWVQDLPQKLIPLGHPPGPPCYTGLAVVMWASNLAVLCLYNIARLCIIACFIVDFLPLDCNRQEGGPRPIYAQVTPCLTVPSIVPPAKTPWTTPSRPAGTPPFMLALGHIVILSSNKYSFSSR